MLLRQHAVWIVQTPACHVNVIRLRVILLQVSRDLVLWKTFDFASIMRHKGSHAGRKGHERDGGGRKGGREGGRVEEIAGEKLRARGKAGRGRGRERGGGGRESGVGGMGVGVESVCL
jgi:hypothetical protein